jgi:hypothetical protein
MTVNFFKFLLYPFSVWDLRWSSSSACMGAVIIALPVAQSAEAWLGLSCRSAADSCADWIDGDFFDIQILPLELNQFWPMFCSFSAESLGYS